MCIRDRYYYEGEPNYKDYTSLQETTDQADGLRAMLLQRNRVAVNEVNSCLLYTSCYGMCGVVGPRRGKKVGEQNVLESTAIEHDSCVCEAKRSLRCV